MAETQSQNELSAVNLKDSGATISIQNAIRRIMLTQAQLRAMINRVI